MGSLVSLVMSDIVGSTRRWAADDAAMAADLELHDRLVVDVVAVAGGRVFKHTGDGMIAVFDDPVAAVSAAAGIQRAVGAASWRQADGLQVRVAVHSGVVYERDGDMFGTAVNKLARILGACPSGAVLVSNAVAVLLAERAPEGVGVRAVGEVALAGFTAPELVHAVMGVGLVEVEVFAAVAAPELRGGSLPPIDDELVGRADELAAIWDGLARARLVTLVGVGGMGKTRLALEVAAGSTDVFPDGVWWVDLATATSDEAVLPVAMGAVGAQERAGRSAIESFCDRFAGRSALIVVDNCEHVLAASSGLVQALRVAAPDVRVVATSREALGVRGEHLVPVGSLPGSDGAALFVERALAVKPDLDIEADRATIEELCVRLDGIPLAIELAAARCRSMLPAEIATRLGDRFRLLRGGRGGAERHRTLQAAVAWSYEMLDDEERHVFLHLAVFAGGTLIDGLAAVCGMDEFDVLDIVDRLVARSLVVTSRTPLGTRYHQLETLRQFAEDRLVDSGGIGEARDRHLAWAHQLACWINASTGTPRGSDAFNRFCGEVDNVRIAVAHASGTGHHHLAHEIVAGVAACAMDRPVLEVFDWVRPIRLEGEWTDAAAICAASGGSADFLRGIPLAVGPLGGVPERFVRERPLVAARDALIQSAVIGHRQHVITMLEQVPVDTDVERLAVDRAWIVVHWHRQRHDRSGAGLDEHTLAGLRHRADAALDLAQRLGDELAYARIAWCTSLAYSFCWPEKAMELASQAMEIGERHGADTTRNYGVAAYHQALGVVAEKGQTPAIDILRAVREPLTRALAAGNFDSAVSLLRSVIAFVFDYDPATVFTLGAVWRRFVAGNTWLISPLELSDLPEPDDWSEWDRRARHLSYSDAISLALATVDSMIAEGGGS